MVNNEKGLMTHHIPEDDEFTSGYDSSDFRSYKDTFTTSTKSPEDVLLAKLSSHLASIQNKSGTKHEHKKNVLNAAINALKGEGDKSTLQEAISANPQYNKAIFSSKTESLVGQAIELASSKRLGPGK